MMLPKSILRRSACGLRLLVGLLVLVGGLGCERRTASPPSLEELRAASGPEQENWGTHYRLTIDGRPRLEIMAAHMAQFEEEDSTYTLLQGDSLAGRVKALVFDEAGQASATIEADQLLYFNEEERYEARGEVVVVSEDDRRLEGEHLVWDEAERKIRTPHFVRITTPQERIQGYELVADEDLDTYSLARITGQVSVEE